MNDNCRERLLSVGSLHQVGGEGLTDDIDANTFVLTGEYPVMFECGSRRGYPDLKRQLGRLGLEVSDIHLVFATHGDYDHVSGMELMQQESDAALLVPSEDRVAVETGDDILTEAVYYGEVAHPIKVVGEVGDGLRMKLGEATIRAIKTPWHTPGSVCYEIEENGMRTLLTGDTLYGALFLNRSQNVEEDIRSGRESIERLMEREYDYISFGHAVKGFRGDGTRRVKEAYRQFAPHGVSYLVEQAQKESRININPWYKIHGQYFKY